MTAERTRIPGVRLFTPRVFSDARGEFLELWHLERYGSDALRVPFVQDNVSTSRQGVLRGLHFQYPNPQGKLVHVLDGEIYDVAVDLRSGSPSFGQWLGVHLSPHQQIWLPPGLAHGFCVTSSRATILYKCTDFYRPDAEVTLAHDDPALGIDWPVAAPLMSDKDRRGRVFAELDASLLMPFEHEEDA